MDGSIHDGFGRGPKGGFFDAYVLSSLSLSYVKPFDMVGGLGATEESMRGETLVDYVGAYFKERTEAGSVGDIGTRLMNQAQNA